MAPVVFDGCGACFEELEDDVRLGALFGDSGSPYLQNAVKRFELSERKCL